jgi:hypothetical protein
MEMSRDAIFMGRPVEVRVVSLGVLLDSNDIQEAASKKEPPDTFAGGFHVVAHALFWKDTGERVFAKAADVRDVPAPYMRQLIDLTNLASQLSNQVAPDAVEAPEAAPNGHDSRPSL